MDPNNRVLTRSWCILTLYDITSQGSLVGSVSASYANGPEIDPRVQRILSWKIFLSSPDSKRVIQEEQGERTDLVVRASDSGSGDSGSILGRVGVLFPLARDIYSPKVLVIPRNRWLRLNMTEKLFTGTLNKNQNKTKKSRRASCQLLAKEWALSTDKLPLGGLPKDSVVK